MRRRSTHGEVWEEEAYEYTLPIRNDNPHPVEVRQFVTSCRCAAAEPQAASLTPGETIDVHLKLDLARRSLNDLGQASRPFAVSVAPWLKSSGETFPRTGSGPSRHGQ